MINKFTPPRTSEEFCIQKHDNWEINKNDIFWTMYNPPLKPMQSQGFKIHISTTYAGAEQTLVISSKILLRDNIAFKHVKNKKLLYDMYSKIGNRISSGKFITAYPNDHEFLPLLVCLFNELAGLEKGPYILTDKRYKNSNVYYRYGAFKVIKNDDGINCIIDDNGKLVPDIREPRFYLPDFVNLPQELKELDENEDIAHNNTENKLDLYEIATAIRFSNSGGIYRAKRKADGKSCIIKEARANIGLDTSGRNAAQRLQIENDALLALKNVNSVVDTLDYFMLWDSTFLVQEQANGEPLKSWIDSNYPFYKTDDTHVYFTKIIKIIDNIKLAIEYMHAEDIAHNDLQTKNIIIDENLNIKLIDFETAEKADNKGSHALRIIGFSHVKNNIAKDRDWFSLNRIFHYCLLPIGSVFELDFNINVNHCIWINNNFGNEAYSYFYDFQTSLKRKISAFNDIFSDTYSNANDVIIKNETCNLNIEDVAVVLKNGLLVNCDKDSENLIVGNDIQFEQDCGMLSMQNGGFGAVLALFRQNALTSDVHYWVKRQLPTLFDSNYNDGFLTDRAGIACVLYECGYKSEALQLFNIVIDNYNKNNSDISFRTGLTGIAIALLSVYKEEHNNKYLSEAKGIADKIIYHVDNSENDVWLKDNSIKIGLLEGYSGISVLFSALYSITNEQKYLNASMKAIKKDILAAKTDDFLSTPNKNILTKWYLPNAKIGVALAIFTLNKVTKETYFLSELENICSNLNNNKIIFEPGLLFGTGSLLLISSFYDGLDLDDVLTKLNLFLINRKDTIALPTKKYDRVSFDMQTGNSGVLLAIQCMQAKNPWLWLPMLYKLFDISP